ALHHLASPGRLRRRDTVVGGGIPVGAAVHGQSFPPSCDGGNSSYHDGLPRRDGGVPPQQKGCQHLLLANHPSKGWVPGTQGPEKGSRRHPGGGPPFGETRLGKGARQGVAEAAVVPLAQGPAAERSGAPADTPMMRQYLEMKARAPDAFLFFRL